MTHNRQATAPDVADRIPFAIAVATAQDEAEFYTACIAHSNALAAAPAADRLWFEPLAVPGFPSPVHFGAIAVQTRRRLGLAGVRPIGQSKARAIEDAHIAAERRAEDAAARNGVLTRLRETAGLS